MKETLKFIESRRNLYGACILSFIIANMVLIGLVFSLLNSAAV